MSMSVRDRSWLKKEEKSIQEISVSRKDLRAPTLAGPSKFNQGSRTPSCNIPLQLTICVKETYPGLFIDFFLYGSKKLKADTGISKVLSNILCPIPDKMFQMNSIIIHLFDLSLAI